MCASHRTEHADDAICPVCRRVPLRYFTGDDAVGGKHVEDASAEEFLQWMWQQAWWQQEPPQPVLLTPQPTRPNAALLQELLLNHEAAEEQSDDDSSISDDIQTVRTNLASRFLAVSSDENVRWGWLAGSG